MRSKGHLRELRRAQSAISVLPMGPQGRLSFVLGVLASHPMEEAQAMAFRQLGMAAQELAAELCPDENDHLCKICDAEGETKDEDLSDSQG